MKVEWDRGHGLLARSLHRYTSDLALLLRHDGDVGEQESHTAGLGTGQTQ